MRQPAKIILLIFVILISFATPALCAVKGGVKYSVPIYYDSLSEQELQIKAKKYFYNTTKLKDGVVNEDMTNALNLYTALQKINPENITYSIRLGILYDKLGKDRYAKGNFSRAIGINKSNSDGYFYMGEFYYKRELYRSALKYYKKAYEYTNGINYNLSYRLGDIYEKLGDTRTSIKYLKEAELQNPNQELSNKIRYVEAQNSLNNKFYQ